LISPKITARTAGSPMDIHKIKQRFEEEFGALKDLFKCFEIGIDEVKYLDAPCIWHPGVYIWWHPDFGVVKVGRHLTNARKRALEHARDNTGGIMASLGADHRTKILLFNVIDPKKCHWVAALEIYLESILDPPIRSKRSG
jgi:hypothetical protein